VHTADLRPRKNNRSVEAPEIGRILIADDIEENLALLTRLLVPEGHTVDVARDGHEAMQLVAERSPDLVLLDVMMPGLTGFEVCGELKANPATRLIPVVLITGLHETRDRIQGINAGADDFITKPFNVHELRARVQSLLHLKRYTDDLETAESVIVSLALTIEGRDAYTQGHCRRLAAYATALGETLGLDHDDVQTLHRGGFLHDIGKIAVPDAVLLKPGRLTAPEFEIMKQHPIIGERLCGSLRSLARVRPIIRHHHERLDGGGYPDGLQGDSIPLLPQILGIVDLFDAITTERPYKPAHSVDYAFQELSREVARGWRRPDLVEAFRSTVRSGRVAQV
jgi:putative two-component system response regulator